MTTRTVRLGEFLRLDLEKVTVEAGTSYVMAGVRSFGGGLFSRDDLDGTSTSYGRFNRLRSGRVVLSRLFGWEGAITVVPPEFDGHHVSTEFPTFTVDTTVADPVFVAHLCAWPGLWDRLDSVAQGVGVRRRRVNVDDFLKIEIPLPDLEQQESLGRRVQRFAAIASTARADAETVIELCVQVVHALVHRPDLSDAEKNQRGWRHVGLDDVLTLDIDAVPVEDDETYPMVGVYSFGRGLFQKDPVLGQDTSYKKYHRLRAGQIVLSRLFAWEGGIALVGPENADRFASTEFPTFTVNEALAIPEFLQAHLGTETFWGRLRGEAAGVGVRRQRVSADRFLAQEVWLPPHGSQAATVKHLVGLQQMAQDESRREMLEALVPSAINATFADFA